MATWPGPGCGSPMSATLVVLPSIAGPVMITAFICQLLVRGPPLTATRARRQARAAGPGPQGAGSMVTAGQAELTPGLAPVTSTPRAHSCCDRYGARPRDAHRTPGESAVGPPSMTEPRTSRYAPAAHDQSPIRRRA